MRILYLDLDTLRPDHLGCYGYHRDTSPNIDRIAAEGVRFDHCYCSDSPCCPSRAALMTGRFGFHTGLVGHGGTAGDMRLEGPSRGFRGRMGRENLPAVLRRAGLRTVCFSPFAERHDAWWFYAGFEEMHNSGKCGMESAEEITPGVLDWMDRHGRDDNWFIHLNYWDAHVPFRVPEEFGNPFAEEPLPAWLTEAVVAGHTAQAGVQMPLIKQEVFRRYRGGCRHGVADLELPPLPRNPEGIRDLADVRMIVDGYDCGIRYVDTHLGHLFDRLAALGVLEDTAVIISSDHGENLGELGIYGDHITADAMTHHIPLIVRWPGGLCGHVDQGLHYNLDLPPTYAELLQVEPPANWEGRSFATTVTTGQETGREALILSHACGTCQRGVRFGDWYYLHTIHDGYNLLPPELLFHLVEDPHEQVDCCASHPEVLALARRHLAAWTADMMATRTSEQAGDPFETVLREGGPSHVRGALPGTLARLESAEMQREADLLRQRHQQAEAESTHDPKAAT
jgi:choline-sulfatase